MFVEIASGLISYIQRVNGGVTFMGAKPTLWLLLATILMKECLTTKYIN